MWETAGETLKVWEEENQRLMGSWERGASRGSEGNKGFMNYTICLINIPNANIFEPYTII